MPFIESFAIAALVYVTVYELARLYTPRPVYWIPLNPMFLMTRFRAVFIPMDRVTRSCTLADVSASACTEAADACCICLEEFTDSTPLREIIRCKHVFCAECISAWLERRPTCPLCTLNVTEEVRENRADADNGDRIERMNLYMMNQV